MRIFHPNSKELTSWINGATNDQVESHLENCESCAEKLENLFEADEAPELEQVLSIVLEPDSDLAERVEEKVRKRLDSREMLSIMSGLVASGFETTKLLIAEDNDDTK